MKHPLPSAAELNELYRSSWAKPTEHTSETGNTDAAAADEMATRLERQIERPLTGLRLLDFGAGKGTFAHALARRGAEVTAYEPYGAKHLVRDEIDAVDDREVISGTFDGATAIEVIEHLRDPLEFAAWIHDRLNPTGWAFLTTPNVQGLNARLRQQRWREFRKPGHILLFDEHAITTALELAGFTQIRRVRWNIGPHSLPRRALGAATMAMGIHGALRIVAYRG